jgi:hypothetical protein
MTRPRDWDGTTSIKVYMYKVYMYFALGGNSAATMNWQLKINNYAPNSGEWLTNSAAIDADDLLVFPVGPSWYRIYSQTWALAAAQFPSDSLLWEIYFLRGVDSDGEPFDGDIDVLGAELEYEATN